MREARRQLVLDLPVATRFGPEDFLVGGSNEAAWRALHSWSEAGGWPGAPDRRLHLRGPTGSGKSHLAAIWAERADAVTVQAAAIALPDVPDLAARTGIVVEDLDRGALDEPALFHLVNLARERGVPVLLTSARPLDAGLVRTPDLLSRLRLAPCVEIGAPDDALLRAVLAKLFADRQLSVEPNVVEYLVLRIERSLARVAEIVAELDREALSRNRRITRAMAAEILGGGGEGAESGLPDDDD